MFPPGPPIPDTHNGRRSGRSLPGPRGELDTSPDAQRRLILVNEAFRVLADPAERQKYDRRTATCVRRPPPPPRGDSGGNKHIGDGCVTMCGMMRPLAGGWRSP